MFDSILAKSGFIWACGDSTVGSMKKVQRRDRRFRFVGEGNAGLSRPAPLVANACKLPAQAAPDRTK
jgi:hypothetical protein